MNIQSTIATPLAIVGFGTAAIGYIGRTTLHSWGFAVAYGLLVVGMMKELQEEAGFRDKKLTNYYVAAGYFLASIMCLLNKEPIYLVGSIGFLVLGLTQFPQVSKGIQKALTIGASALLVAYYIANSTALLNARETNLVFASNTILAVYYGIFLGTIAYDSK